MQRLIAWLSIAAALTLSAVLPLAFAANTQVQLRRDTTANIAAYGPLPQGELGADVTRNALVLGDGTTSPGHYVTPFGCTTCWTPTISGDGTAGSQSYSAQEGSYLKIGKLVIAQMRVILTANSGGTGNARIAGLPFAAASGTNTNGSGIVGWVAGVTHQSSYTQFHASVNPGTSTAYIAESGLNQALTTAPIGNIGAAADISVTFVYQAASDSN